MRNIKLFFFFGTKWTNYVRGMHKRGVTALTHMCYHLVCAEIRTGFLNKTWTLCTKNVISLTHMYSHFVWAEIQTSLLNKTWTHCTKNLMPIESDHWTQNMTTVHLMLQRWNFLSQSMKERRALVVY